MSEQTIPTKFDVSLYGEMEQLTPTLSKCRLRTFYKGFNRNRTYISEEFAQQLIDSLPYAPVKGIFDEDTQEYMSHGKENSEGRIYGIVPAEPNFAWEPHLDEDGVTREYACTDVLIYTGLYSEASLIVGKSQSMEIFKGNLKGEWRTWKDGKPYYHFLKGCLVGLQILGDSTEPCFEGAAFFNLYKDIQEAVEFIKQFQLKEGEKNMEIDINKFRLSDSEKAQKIEKSLNGENGTAWWVINTYDDYAVARNWEEDKLYRVYYEKENDEVIIGEKVEVFIIDVTRDEQIALEALKAAAGSYEVALEKFNEKVEVEVKSDEDNSEVFALNEKISTLEEKIAQLESEKQNFEATIAEKDSLVSDFTSKEDEWKAEKVVLEQKVSDITIENNELASFKRQVELEKKEAILTKYEEHLPETTYTNLKDTINNFSIEDFNKEVCTAVLESNGGILDEKSNSHLIPKVQEQNPALTKISGSESILRKYYN